MGSLLVRGALGGAARVVLFTRGVFNAVGGDVDGQGRDGALNFVGLDVVEAPTAAVWECPSLIHTAPARDAAGFRQSLMMPVIVRLSVASDTLVAGGAYAGDTVVFV